MPTITASKILVLLACIIFVLAAFGVSPGSLALVPLGLAFWAAAQLVP